jgi:N-methylhydantoinase A
VKRLVGVDIGGTNTDMVMVDTETGELRTAKVPSTLQNQAIGLMNGLAALDITADSVQLLTHGTTVATNATIERKGARCGLLMTKGFRDILELRRRDRPQTYGLLGSFKPLIDREFRLEITERIGGDGEVIEPLDEAEVMAAASKLRDKDCEVLVICFLHSYANPEHEKRARELAATVWPNKYIVLSSEILPVLREFERTSTSVVAGYVQPLLDRYLGSLTDRLARSGYKDDLLVVQSNGGLVSAPLVGRFAANTILSGPAAGVTAAVSIARGAGLKDVVSCDMGGTSFDLCVIKDLVPSGTSQQLLDFGVPLCVPMIDVHAIGAGGGSIARIDASGILQIGPDSAGSEPGPACFGLGGQQPTITDANLVLGYFGSGQVIGKDAGRRFDVSLARAAIERVVARPLGLAVEEAAEAMLKVAGTKMGAFVRKKLLERGLDPRGFSLVAFGGAGPLHANRILRESGCKEVLLPPFPGITSAMGCLLGPLRHDFIRAVNREVEGIDLEQLVQVFTEHANEGISLLEQEGVPRNEITVTHSADMSYVGQTHSIPVTLPATATLTREAIREAFDAAYVARYTQTVPGYRVALANAKTSVAGKAPVADMGIYHKPQAKTVPPAGRHAIFIDGAARDAAVYQRHELPAGHSISGPALLLQPDATTLVDPGFRAEVHASGSIFIRSEA